MLLAHIGGSGTRRLAAVSATENSIIVYSVATGQTAQDGIFTPILTKLITQKNKTIETVLREVRSEVYKKTDGKQEPRDNTGLMCEVYLAGIDTVVSAKQASSTVALTRPSAKLPTQQGSMQINRDITYTVKEVNFTMKHIDSVTDVVLGDNNRSDNQKHNIDTVVDALFRNNNKGNNKEHKVSLSSYCIGETEVTQQLWKTVMEVNPSRFTDSDNNSVERVSWFDCI